MNFKLTLITLTILSISLVSLFAAPFTKIDSLSEIPDRYQPVGTVYFFDIDDTLFDSPTMLGSKAWRKYILEATKDDPAHNWHDIFSLFIARYHPLKTVESTTSEFVQNLQLNGYTTFGLTARERKKWYNTPIDDVDLLTVNQLQSVGIDFNNSIALATYPFLTDDSEYFQGIFFANLEPTGEYFLTLFKKAKLNAASFYLFNKSDLNEADPLNQQNNYSNKKRKDVKKLKKKILSSQLWEITTFNDLLDFFGDHIDEHPNDFLNFFKNIDVDTLTQKMNDSMLELEKRNKINNYLIDNSYFQKNQSFQETYADLINNLAFIPNKVIFIDNKQSQVESVAAALDELGIEHECYWYTATDKKAEQFSPLIANVQLYYLWISNGTHILSDEEAELIAMEHPEKDAESYLRDIQRFFFER